MSEKICRICRIKKRKNFVGYGFNLETKNDDRCHFIGIVDPNSPASQSGLRGGDKIIEINNTNVEFFKHDQIVNLIKAGLNINDIIYKDEVLLTVRSKPSDKSTNKKQPARQFKEPKFLKNLNFDVNSPASGPYNPGSFLRVDNGNPHFRTSKSVDSLLNKNKQGSRVQNENCSDESEVVIFI